MPQLPLTPQTQQRTNQREAGFHIGLGCGGVHQHDLQAGSAVALGAVHLVSSSIRAQTQAELEKAAALERENAELADKQNHLGSSDSIKDIAREELQRILKVNPDYYHEMAPYALALGVDQIFAKRFERLHQPNCTYLHTSTENNRSAAEWDALLRKVVDTLNERQKRLRFERFFR